jgi:hypothetical protein
MELPMRCVSRGTDFEENKKRPLGSFGRVAFRMNCRYRAPVPFTLWSLRTLGVTTDSFAV